MCAPVVLHAGVVGERGGQSVLLQAHVSGLHIPDLCGYGPRGWSRGCAFCSPLVAYGHLVHLLRKRAAVKPLAQVRLLLHSLTVVPVQGM